MQSAPGWIEESQNQADQLQAYHGKVINYDSYCHLLLSAASNYDAKYAPKGRVDTIKAPMRNVYVHDLANYEDDEFYDVYNLDSDIVDCSSQCAQAEFQGSYIY